MRRVLPTVLALVLGGCFWQQPGAGPGRNAHNPFETGITVATAPGLVEVWSVQLDEGPAGDPVTSTSGVHVSDTRSVYAFAPRSGADLWRYDVAAPLAMQQPIAHDDEIYINRWDATAVYTDGAPSPVASDAVIRLDAATGAVEDTLAEAVAVARRGSRVLLWDNSFIRLGMAGQYPFWRSVLTVRDLGTGVNLCCGYSFGLFGGRQPPPLPPNLTLGSTEILHAGDGLLTENPPETGNAIRGYTIGDDQPCVDLGSLYLCPNWIVPLPGTTATAPVLNADETLAYVGTDSGRFAAVDLVTHAVRWEVQAGSAVTAPPALANGKLYVPLASGDLTVMDAATGEVLGGYATGSSIDVQPAVAGEVVYAGSAAGTVHAFDAGCVAGPCPALWTASTGSAITGAPAVSSGRVFVGAADGRLVAYGLS